MSILDQLLAHRAGDTSDRTDADAIMHRLNPQAVHAQERGKMIFIEDVKDPDGRLYRVEYQSDSRGRNAQAYCRYNPWGGNPYSAPQSHLFDDGKICLGSGTFNLEEVVGRSRSWCTAYSFMREHGYEATCRVMPEWRG